MNWKRFIYKSLAMSNDINAIQKHKIGRRIARRIYGKVAGDIARRLFG